MTDSEQFIGRAGASPPSRTAAIIFLYIYLFIYLFIIGASVSEPPLVDSTDALSCTIDI